jgi:hypothetical protein
VIEQLGGHEEVEPGVIVDILVDRLECGPVDRTGVDAVRGETVAASPREWLQQVFAVSEPTQAKPDEVPDVGVTRARDHLLISAPLYLRGSSLEHTVGTRAGGLAQIIAGVADHVGLGIETVRAEDL